MAIYYAITRNGQVMYDTRNGQLEMYEEYAQANRAKRSGDEIMTVDVKRSPIDDLALPDMKDADARGIATGMKL